MASHPLGPLGAPADVAVPQALHRDAFSRVPHLNLRDLWFFFSISMDGLVAEKPSYEKWWYRESLAGVAMGK